MKIYHIKIPIWVEVVDESGSVGIYIEDGEICK